MKIFEITHMQRSGGHACIKWLINNYYSEHIDLESVDVEFLNKTTKLMKIKGKKEKEALFLNQYITNGRDLDEQCLAYVNKVQPELFFISYENMPINFSAFNENIPTQKILEFRRFRNFYASFCKVKNTNAEFRWLVKQWIKHAEYALENDNVIFFDKWVLDKEYRKQLADTLNLPFKYDRTKRNSGQFGTGSSFDGNNTEVKEEELLNRYKQFNFSQQQKEMIEFVKTHKHLNGFI